MDLHLTDQVFITTAASGGLGFATARALVAEGARVVLVARRAEVLDRRVAELGSDHAVALAADLADPDTARRACATARDTWGRLDGAFLSVGGPPAGTPGTNTDDEWRGAFESVFLAAVRLMDQVVADAGDPTIGLVLSSSARVPIDDLTVSNGLRPGLAMLISQYATHYGPGGARFFGLLPGKIATDRMQELIDGTDDPQAAQAATEASIPLGRIGEPAEFARVAAFLLSPAASYVSGCVVPVDGGMLPMP